MLASVTLIELFDDLLSLIYSMYTVSLQHKACLCIKIVISNSTQYILEGAGCGIIGTIGGGTIIGGIPNPDGMCGIPSIPPMGGTPNILGGIGGGPGNGILPRSFEFWLYCGGIINGDCIGGFIDGRSIPGGIFGGGGRFPAISCSNLQSEKKFIK